MKGSALLCLGLVALVVLVFEPALDAAFLNWDDNLLVTSNPSFRGLSPEHLRWMLGTFHGGHWEPLTWLSLALDHALWGIEPRGYHATSIALHAANTVALFVLARVLFPALGRGGAAAAAALFAVHPLRAESVAWIAERRDVLSAFFFLATAILWARARRGSRALLSASYATFGLGLCAKAAGLAWPFVFLSIDLWTGRWRERGARRVLAEKVPYLVLAVAAALPALEALERFGATRLGGALSPAQRAAQMAYGLFFYPARTLVPVGLSPLYLLDRELDPFSARYVLPALGFLAATAALVAATRRLPGGLLAWAAYVLLIFPFLGLASNGIHLAADRYSYVACLPFALLAAGGLVRVAAGGGTGRAVALVTGGLAVVVLGLCARRQTLFWLDSESLWTRAIAVEPESYVALNLRGLARKDARDFDGALADFSRAIEVRPAYVSAYDNRGIARLEEGDFTGAASDLGAALELEGRTPLRLFYRGVALLSAGDKAQALSDLESALALAPPAWPLRRAAEEKAAEARASR